MISSPDRHRHAYAVPVFGDVRGDDPHSPPLGGRFCSRGRRRRTRRPQDGRGASIDRPSAQPRRHARPGAEKGATNDRDRITGMSSRDHRERARDDENARQRRDPALARGRGRRRHVRDPRRGDPADLRRDRARHDRAAHPRPPRAGRRPHGRGLRARLGQGRRRDRDLGPGRDEPRDGDRRCLDGLDPARLHHGPGEVEPDRHRRLPGDRRDRDHDADRQALLARPGRARAAAGDEDRLPRRHAPAARARCSSTSRRTRRRPSSTSPTRRGPTCPAGGRRRRCTSARSARPRSRSPSRASRSSTQAAA